MFRFPNTSDKCIAGYALALALFVFPCGAYAQSNEKILHVFQTRSDGKYPIAGLTADSAGNLYGTTLAGSGTGCRGDGCGVVFEIRVDGREKVLHSFSGADGERPYAGLILDAAGNLYGTTSGGGREGGGTVFKLSPRGKETVLYNVGLASYAGLILDGAGNLYGTTTLGGDRNCPDAEGDAGCGIVFELASDGTLTALHAFAGGNDGAYPVAGVIMDTTGNLYGTTEFGGGTGCNNNYGCGTVFKITPDGTETILYSFQGANDGFYPVAGVIADTSGNLYGTVRYGGAHGGGTVFKIASNGTESTLYSFCSQKDCSDGTEPEAGLLADASWNLYGTTFHGGAKNCRVIYYDGCGTVFKLAVDGTETVLYAFTGGESDGKGPLAGLISDSAGNMYGTTAYHAHGTVFEISNKELRSHLPRLR